MTILPVAASTMAMWLFSCSVTAISFLPLKATNSGSGSSGATSAMPVRSTVLMPSQSGTPAASGTIFKLPAGICGISPSLTSSSRSFSMAIAAKAPSLLTAIESGWPPRSQVVSIALLARSMTVRLPDGLALLSDGVDAGKHLAAGDRDRRRLAVDLDDAAGLRRLGIGDVDEADRAVGAVGIDQRVAVLAGGDDLRRGRLRLVGIGRQVRGDREGGDAVEHHVGVGGEGHAARQRGGKQGKAGLQRRHYLSPFG